MKNLILILLLFVSFQAFSQPTNYTKRLTRERLIATYVDSSIHIRAYNGVPSGLPVGTWTGDGALAMDSTTGYLYVYQNNTWIKIAKFSDLGTGYTFSNGLTESPAGTVKWGGQLTGNTTISGTGNRSVTFDSITTFNIRGRSSPIFSFRGNDGATLVSILESGGAAFWMKEVDPATGDYIELSADPTRWNMTNSRTVGNFFQHNSQETGWTDQSLQNQYQPASTEYFGEFKNEMGSHFTTRIANQTTGSIYNKVDLISTGIELKTKIRDWNTYKGMSIDLDHQVTLDSVVSFTDTTNWKPLVVNTTGSSGTLGHIRKATYWPGGGGGITTVGTIDTQTPSDDGAVISGSSIYFQTFTDFEPGLVPPSGEEAGNTKFLRQDGTWQVPSAGSVAWNSITNPTADQALTFDAGESSTWTNSNTTEDLFTVNSSTITTSSFLSLNSTSTALAAGNNLAEFVMSGANGTNAITATGLRVSVTNTNATSGTNVGLNITATGATTDNQAINATGRVIIKSPAAGVYNSLTVLRNNGDIHLQVGGLPSSEDYTGIWLGNVTPTAANHTFYGNNTNLSIQAVSSIAHKLSEVTVSEYKLLDGAFFGLSMSRPIHLVAGVTGYASLRMPAGVAPSSPVDGDHWYEDTNDRLMFRQNATSVELVGVSAVNTTTATSPNRTLTVLINGTTYYIHAKTTND